MDSCSILLIFFFFSSRRRHTRSDRDWSSDVCSSDLLPFGKGLKGAAGQLASGWQLNTIVTISSGVPFGIFIDGDPDGDKSDDNGARPNLLPGVSLSSGGGSPDRWFNLAAFAPPTVGFRGS